MKVEKECFGILESGEEITRIHLATDSGLTISAMDYGANLLSVHQPDREGVPSEITLGFDSLARYQEPHPYFGATIGRYANRISGGAFTIDGKRYALHLGSDGVHLHGGKAGFDKKKWDAEVEADAETATIRFHRLSPAGEENYPGNLEVWVSFVLSESGELVFEYEAVCDATTPLNLTNHTYWNLDGPGNTIYEQLLAINASRVLDNDDNLIPTGDLTEVGGTPYDFRNEKLIGSDVDTTGGYDHCFVLDDTSDGMKLAATVRSTHTGRCMSVETTQPAIQFYAGNKLDGIRGKENIAYYKHGALCLETGAYNNAVNLPHFPNTILLPGQTFRSTTKHRFWQTGDAEE